ncbi:NAD(P)H-dependent oxidoreductase [bacterium]|nr:NAD(P)H-dependent oxidoreductase [bacterium]
MKLLAFAASLRTPSLNRKLITLVAEMARARGAEVDLVNFHAFDMPLYDGDIEERSGLPAGAVELVKRIAASDGLIIASPEYNYSIPGPLKNAIDWISRAMPVPLEGKSGLLLSASPSVAGGNRGLWALRIPLEALKTIVYPEMFSLASAHEAFDAQGQLKDAANRQRLEGVLEAYLAMARSLVAGSKAKQVGV